MIVVTQRTTAPAYNVVAVFRDRAGFQHRGRLSRPHRLTTLWPSFMTTPAYNKEDNLSVCTGLQRHGRFICMCRLRCCGRIYRPSLTAWSTSTHWAAPVSMSCLLSMSKSLLGKPVFSSNKLEANYHILSTAVCTRCLNGQAHKFPPLQFD